MDLTIISYQITRYALLYNLLLFLIWMVIVRRDGGKVSTVYILVMTVFLARLYGILLGLRARGLRDLGTDNQAYFDFMTGFWWDSRLAPEALVFIILAFMMTRRFVRSYFFSDPEFRAANGRRKTDKHGLAK